MNSLGLTHPLCSSLAAPRAKWVGMSLEMLPTSDGILGCDGFVRQPWGHTGIRPMLLSTGLPGVWWSPEKQGGSLLCPHAALGFQYFQAKGSQRVCLA